MCRLTAALLLAGCLGFQMWAQTPPSQPSAAQTPAAEKAPAGQAASASSPATSNPATSESTQFPLDKFKEFSAIMIGGPVPGTEDPIHIYRHGNLMRMEANEGKTYQITDLAKQETHGIAHVACLRYHTPYVRSYPFSLSGPDNKFERVPVGKETVDGHICQVEDVTITVPKHPEAAKIRLWEAEDLDGFPVKIETKMHRTIQYKNVVLGPQDPTLFIFPEQCQGSETIGGHASSQPKKAPPGKSQ